MALAPSSLILLTIYVGGTCYVLCPFVCVTPTMSSVSVVLVLSPSLISLAPSTPISQPVVCVTCLCMKSAGTPKIECCVVPVPESPYGFHCLHHFLFFLLLYENASECENVSHNEFASVQKHKTQLFLFSTYRHSTEPFTFVRNKSADTSVWPNLKKLKKLNKTKK